MMTQAGCENSEDATAALITLKAELMTQTERPVLFAIDEYNALFEGTPFHFEQKRLQSDQLALVKAREANLHN